MQAQLEQARAQANDSRAALDYARIQLGYTRITAPVDGVVTARLARRGAYVAPGTVLITVVPVQPVWIVANYREVALDHIRPGQRVEVHVDALPGLTDPSFDRALSEAYLYNPQLAAERQRLRETDEGVPQALSGWRPNVSFSSAAVFDNLDKRHVPENRTPDDENLQLMQPLYTGGRVRAQVGQAEALVAAERATLRATEAAVLLAAAAAYLDVAQNARIVLLNRNQAAVLERTLLATRQQYTAGSVTQTDVDQVRARLADQRGTMAQSEAELAASRARFEQQVGTLPGALNLPQLTLALPANRQAALASVAAGNFDVAQARAALEASRLGIDIALAGCCPRSRCSCVGPASRKATCSSCTSATTWPRQA